MMLKIFVKGHESYNIWNFDDGNIYLHKDFIATFTKSSPVYKLR